ncbi:polysaccharide pyruvyl transferase family protein [Leifsonia sp. YIM 134122]|uniref:Polysaccharide pyruvyl transferase family protein n=1 Tax=Leifsonia stereocauli TaxID=3134136 RepID=A0ABU9W6J1_9MICO
MSDQISPRQATRSHRWLLIGSANGSTNLGDESMWLAAADVLRSEHPHSTIVTDAAPGWESGLERVELHPFLLESLRRGKFLSPWTHRSRIVASIERLVSRPGRVAYARRALARAKKGPRTKLQRQWYNEVRSADAVIFTGAGAINDDYAAHGVYSWSLLTHWAHTLGKPVAFLGQGLGPLDASNAAETAKMLKLANVITVREETSLHLATSLIDGAGVTPLLTPDWALALPATSSAQSDARQLVEVVIGGGPFIAMSFHRRRAGSSDLLDQVAVLAESLVEAFRLQGLKVLFVPNMRGNRFSDDRETARILVRSWSAANRDHMTILEPETGPAVTKALLGLADYLISSRYHPMVFALAEGTPSFGVAYDDYYVQKLVGVSSIFGLADNVANLRDPSLTARSIIASLTGQRAPAADDATVADIVAPLRTFIAAVR